MEILIIFILITLFLCFYDDLFKSPKIRNVQPSKKQNQSFGASQKPRIDNSFFAPFEGKAHVIDGDTIIIRGRKIRLAGINAPELDQPWGQKSKWEMVKIVKGKIVRVVPNGETSYDRIVATCFIDENTDIGAELISRGLARDIPVFTNGKYKSFETPAGRRRIRAIPYRNTSHPSPQNELSDRHIFHTGNVPQQLGHDNETE
jgi:endonuclease YncB( thermonuclease family)